MKMGRISLDLAYVVDMDNEDMVNRAKECFYEDIMQAVKYGELGSWIDVQPDNQATPDMIPQFLTEEDA